LLLSLMVGLSSVSVSKARGDILYLTDGTRLEGEVKKSADGWTVTDAGGKKTTVGADKVESIEATGSAATPDAAMDRLWSLRRSVSGLSDIHEIIRRYNRFIEQYKDTTVADEAIKDLADWQDKLDKGLVKMGDKWVAPEERDEIAAKSLAGAREARALMLSGHMQGAEDVLEQCLKDDPHNASALYLRGLILFDIGKTVESRKAFEAVIAAAPDHAPSEANLAVIMFRQSQFGGAMLNYGQAMTNLPLNKDILDDVAEALNALPAEEKQSNVALRAGRLFAEQDTALQKTMGENGWYRWGATWVNQKQLDDLHAAEDKIKGQLDELQKTYDGVNDDITRLNGEIEDNERVMRRMEAESVYRDASGTLIGGVMPDSYYGLQQDNEGMSRQRDADNAKLQQLRDQATRIQQTLPVPKYTGVQEMLGPEYAPEPVNVPAATQPGN
jgi:tetratricopeptide (TPR) repeat protein